MPLKPRRRTLHGQVVFAVILACVAGATQATDIYTWKDEQGHTHVADSVPERYKKVATRIDSKQFQVPEGERAAAVARSAKERERIAAIESQRAREKAPTLPASPASSAASTSKPREGESECDRLWREYFESQECFAPYQSRSRGTKAEAYGRCKEVESPTARCGPARNWKDG